MNTRKTRFAMFRGQMTAVVEISAILGIDPETLWYRVQNGLDLERVPDRTTQRRGRPRRVFKPRVKEDSLFNDSVPYEHDLPAQIAVALAVQRGRGLSLEEVSQCMGLSRARIQQIEQRAIERVTKRLRVTQGRTIRDWLEMLDEARATSNADRVEMEADVVTSSDDNNVRRRLRSRANGRAA